MCRAGPGWDGCKAAAVEAVLRDMGGCVGLYWVKCWGEHYVAGGDKSRRRKTKKKKKSNHWEQGTS